MKNFIEKRLYFEKKLRDYDRRKFKIIFEHSPIAIIEQDATSLAEYIKTTQNLSIPALEKSIKNNPQPLIKAFQEIKFLEANRAALRLYRVSNIVQLRKNVLKIIPRVPIPAFIYEFLAFRKGENLFEYEFNMKRLNNKFINVLMRVAVPKGMEKTLSRIILTFQDITERKRIELRLKDQAQKDSLTGVLNHKAIEQVLEQEMNRSRKYKLDVSCIIIDLDRFKEINDRYGHLKGDQVLQNFSEILQKTIRKTDSIGRYGGDEFVLVLPETRPDQAQFLIKRIQKCLSKNQPLKSLFVRIKFSFGISNLIYKNDTVKKLLVRADKNLYQLKRDTSRKY